MISRHYRQWLVEKIADRAREEKSPVRKNEMLLLSIRMCEENLCLFFCLSVAKMHLIEKTFDLIHACPPI